MIFFQIPLLIFYLFLVFLVLLWLLMPLIIASIKRSLGREIFLLRRILKELKSINAQLADVRNKAAIKPEVKADKDEG